MPVTVVVGAQFGSEGKGKIVAYLSQKHSQCVVVRCGGPNSGHTISFDNNTQFVLRQIPSGVVNPDSILMLAPGCLIDVPVLLSEISRFNLTPERLRIDRNCVIIEPTDSSAERRLMLGQRIGSTCSGTGFALTRRILRGKDVRLAKDVSELSSFIADVVDELNVHIRECKRIIVEGTQGFGLSLYHSPYYPFATSRDTTAAAFLSEAGLSPFDVSEVILVVRTFPIRVGGNSGPLPNEISWEEVRRESGYVHDIREFTSVTRRLRRVGRFDLEIVKRAVMVNKPTSLALMGVDYINSRNRGVTSYQDLTNDVKEFVSKLESELGVRVRYIGTGPCLNELIDLSLS